MLYKPVDKNLNFKDRELEVLKFWKENRIFEKQTEQNAGREPYTFYDGPPTANGKPHIGHILTRCIKDLIPRYHTMKGRDVLRKAGWDTHGLPVELEVEKLLGLDGKEQIEQYGVEPFIEECKKSVWKYKTEWERMSERVGFWADMEHPYITYDNNYIESVWWSLKKIHEKGLLYKGHKVVPYCPRCGTALSSHEVAQGYKDVEEASVFVKFKAKDEPETYFLAWTTTPWTLPSNVALCVHPREKYVKAEAGDEMYIMAAALVDSVLGPEARVVEEYVGKDLEYREYEPLYDFGAADKKAYYVTVDEYVTLTDGTGIVHNAPAFGEDDARVGRNYDLPFVQMVDEKGRFKPGTPWEGVFVKEADPAIIEDLKARGLLLATQPYLHSYPFCWRCDTPLLYYARSTWFIRMTAVKDLLLKNNRAVNWLPENSKEGRMGNFLENVIDWGLSRERYWGTPLPVWTCDCGHIHVVGSIAELREMGNNVPEDIELHKPFIDAVILRCPQCGGDMKRVPEVIDCWYDSGAMPFAQWHYPFENKEVFEERFPADFISEAVDQTRGWFYSLLAIATLIFGETSFKNCVVLGGYINVDNEKMSKSKGNAIEPMDALTQYGADAIRWYFSINSALWLPNRFHGGAVIEGQRKFMGTLWNTYAFYVLYANIDKFDPTKYRLEYDKLSVMDKWLLSRLNSLIKAVDGNLENYRITESARLMSDFVDELSNWYVRRSRERFWAKGMPQDKINAYMTLYTALVEFSKLAAPYIPFMTEDIYQNLVVNLDKNAPESIHLCSYPAYNEDYIDKELEENMNEVLEIVVLGRSCRNAANIKNRQPIGKMYVKANIALSEYYRDIIADELNVKEVIFTDDVRAFTSYSFKPQLKTLGPKFGKQIGAVRQILAEVNGNEAMDEINATGKLGITLDGTTVYIDKEDLLIEAMQTEGYISDSDHGITVILDTHLTDELIEEGFVREIISKLQTMRKDAGFEVTDHIRVTAEGNDRIKAILERNADEIKSEVLADELEYGRTQGYTAQWNINGENVTFGVERLV